MTNREIANALEKLYSAFYAREVGADELGGVSLDATQVMLDGVQELCRKWEALTKVPIPNRNKILDEWIEFGDVPMNPETECIEHAWRSFPAGTHRYEVWRWFQDTYGVSIIDLMVGCVRPLFKN